MNNKSTYRFHIGKQKKKEPNTITYDFYQAHKKAEEEKKQNENPEKQGSLTQ